MNELNFLWIYLAESDPLPDFDTFHFGKDRRFVVPILTEADIGIMHYGACKSFRIIDMDALTLN